MSEQMIYTSCRKGIDSLENGYKIYSYSKNIDRDLLSQLVRSGSYSIRSTDLPTIIDDNNRGDYPLAFRYVVMNGHHAITRSRYLGVDWSGTRFGSNYLAHSITIEDQANYPIEYFGSRTFERNIDLSLFSSDQEVKPLDSIIIEPNVVDYNCVCTFIKEKGAEPVKAFFSSVMKGGNIIIKDSQDNIPRWIAACTMILPTKMAFEIPYSSFDDHGWESTYPGIVGIWSSDDMFECRPNDPNNDNIVDEYIDVAFKEPSIRNDFIRFVDEKYNDAKLADLSFLLEQFYYFKCERDYLDDIVDKIRQGSRIHSDIAYRCICDLLKTDEKIKENIGTIKDYLLPLVTKDSLFEEIDDLIRKKNSLWMECQGQSIDVNDYNKYEIEVLGYFRKGIIIDINSVETAITLSNWTSIENDQYKQAALDYLKEHENLVEQLILKMVSVDKKRLMLRNDNPYGRKVSILRSIAHDNHFNINTIFSNESQYPADVVEEAYHLIINEKGFRVDRLFNDNNRWALYKKVVLDVIDSPGLQEKSVCDVLREYMKKNGSTTDIISVLEIINDSFKKEIHNIDCINPDYRNCMVFDTRKDFLSILNLESGSLKSLHYLTLNHTYSRLKEGKIDLLPPLIDVEDELLMILYEDIINMILNEEGVKSTDYIDFLEEISKKKNILYDVICRALLNHNDSKNYSDVATSFLEKLLSISDKPHTIVGIVVDSGSYINKSDSTNEIDNRNIDPKPYCEQLLEDKRFVKVVKVYAKETVEQLPDYLKKGGFLSDIKTKMSDIITKILPNQPDKK